MAAIYLYLNAALWVGLGIKCSFGPEQTSRSLGLAITSPAGRCEFITVYGGLEIGLGGFFLFAALDATWAAAGVLAALFSYAGLGLARLGAVLLVPNAGRAPLVMLGVEAVMLLWAAWIHFGAPTVS